MSPQPDLQIDERPRFQIREWRTQRFGLLVLAGLLAAAAFYPLGTPHVLVRVAAIYAFLLVVFRIAGKRTVAEMTSFDLVVVLVIGDATQQGLIGEDYTITTAVVAVSALIMFDVALGSLKSRWPALDRVVDGLPLLLVARGRLLQDRMRREGIDLDDILAAAREQHGLRRLEEIEYAVLERHGGVSIVPRRPGEPPDPGGS